MPAEWVELPRDGGRWNAYKLDLITAVLSNEGAEGDEDAVFATRIIVNTANFDPILDGYIAARPAHVLAFLLRARQSHEVLLRFNRARMSGGTAVAVV